MLLLVSLIVPHLLDRRGAASEPATARAAGLDSEAFARYLQAEQQTRFLIAQGTLGRAGIGDSGGEALAAYRRLARETGSPNMGRKALILGALLKRPFDPALLDTLEEALRSQKIAPDKIAAERRLWTALYGSDTASLPPDSVARVRAMELRFLGDRALADVYRRSGAADEARAAEKRLNAAALRAAAVTGLFVVLAVLAVLAGLVFLTLFLAAWARGRWEGVARVATAPQPIEAGLLIDAFMAYLALYRLVGLLGSLTIGAGGPRIPLMAAAQIGSGLLGIGYLAWRVRRGGGTLVDVGATTRTGGLADLGYGIAGYCAALPLMLAASLLARLIFHDGGIATAPNPMLPLLAGERDLLNRVLLALMATIAAPAFEEFFFRGALFTALRARLRWVPSALISATVFACMHPVRDWLPILVLGFAFATMREMRQSLVPGLVAHALQNTLAYIGLSALSG
jgi:membrane protease YdiL (CAAX protease family)